MFGFWSESHAQVYHAIPSEESPTEPTEKSASEMFQMRGWYISKGAFHRDFLPLTLSIFFCFSSFIVLAFEYHREPSDLQCAKHLSAPSPFMEAVEYEWRTFENDFLHESIYRGTPTEELEQAWDDLWDYGAFSVPRQMLPGLNKSDDGSWREVPAENGGGVAGLLEAFHQIHCLNLIRQYTYRDQWDYSHLPSFDGSDQLVRHHVDHCIETLRINLMCTGDVTPYLIELNPNKRLGEAPNFNTLHKCSKWDRLVEFAKQKEVFRYADPDHMHEVA